MILDDLYAYLTGPGGLTNVFLGHMPDSPADVTCLYETGGGMTQFVMSPSHGRVLDSPGLQILCRGTTYPIARARAKAIHDLLNGAKSLVLSGVAYHWAVAEQAPYGLPQDALGRSMVGFNVSVTKEPS